MKPLLSISASAMVAAAVLWPAPVRAFHALECGPNRITIVDDTTGRRRCSERLPDAQEVFLRTRQLQLEQERRTRALAAQQRQSAADQRVRDLASEQQQRDSQQALIRELELAKQQQFSREHFVQTLQPALSVEQNTTVQQNLIRIEPEETRKRALVRANELRRRQLALEQHTNLPTVELLDELKARRRQLGNQQREP